MREQSLLLIEIISVIIYSCFFSDLSAAENLIDTLNTTTYRDSIIQQDLDDVVRKILKLSQESENETQQQPGCGPFFSVLPAIGYSLDTRIAGAIASNISFYTDNRKTRLSSFVTTLNYSQNRQYWTTINSNVFLYGKKLNLVGDWRYYKYPTYTFGLGTHSTANNSVRINYSYLKLFQILYIEISPNIYLGPGFQLDYHYNIKDFTHFKIPSDFQLYNRMPSSNSSGFSLNFQYDNVDNSNNPQKGANYNIQYRHNFNFLGSNTNWQSLLLDLRKYFQIPWNSKNVLAFWNYDVIVKGNPPYLDLPSNGWDAYQTTGRGYVQGRFRGRSMLYFESEYRFSLVKSGLLGAVLFSNLGTYSEWITNDFDTLVPGGGLGLRIKLNKNSNTNLAIDYGFGVGRSRGFFFNLGEAF